jgi:hypothetical protein
LLQKSKKRTKVKGVIDQTEFEAGVLRFDLRHEWCQKFLNSASRNNVLPQIDTIALRYIPETDDGILEFIQNSITEVDKLFLNNYVVDSKKRLAFESFHN